MKLCYKVCEKCRWQVYIKLPISKRAHKRYKKHLQLFQERVEWVGQPDPIIPQIDTCKHCDASGLVPSEQFPEPDTKKYPDIAIIGGGIWWVALAVACLHRGIPYTLYERDESFDSRAQWYGLTLQQASKAMIWLWITHLKKGLISIMHIVHDQTGKVIGQWWRRKLSEKELEKRTKPRNIHISRQSLRAQLIDQLDNMRGMKWWYCLKNLSRTQQWKIQLEFQTVDTIQSETVDLVVWADGIRSTVRSLTIGEDIAPLKYLWCIVILWICPLEKLKDIQSALLDSETVFQTVNGHERIYMMPYDRDTIMWQLSFPMCEKEAKTLSKKWSEALQNESIKRLWDWHSPIPEILRATDISNISWYPVYDREILKPDFFKNFWNITLLWDAMHPMSPFKGQWANQALLDALDLARDIVKKCDSDSGWREKWLRKTLLTDFEKNMIERSSPKVRDSAIAVEMLHSEAVLHSEDTPRGRWI